ncbi:MAG: prolipoprotein diacylglyceryl transferase, partial [Pelagibacteraceae bacterium]|nr:prolipoprotein diacylglyceryl transferase [Pelagibacteraceae bacterium]
MIFIQPSISPIALSFGFVDIRWYSLAYIFTFIIGSIIIKKLNKRSYNYLSEKQIDSFFIWAVIGVIIGGRVGYVLFYQTN